MIQIHDVEQGTDEWLRLRADLYTGANADKLLAHSTQRKLVDGVLSPYAIAEITGFKGNFHTKRGHILEDEAIELYQEITGHAVSRPGFVTNSKFPQCGYSPDGHDDVLGIPLEVKAFQESKHMKMFNGEVPIKVQAQIHFGQFIWEKRGARLLIYNPDLDVARALKIIEVPFNRNINSNFRRVLGGVPHAATS